MNRIVTAFCCFILFIGGCRSNDSSPATRAFYYWKTICDLSPTDLAYLSTLRVQKLYVKFFDVDWFDDAPAGAFPVAPVRFGAALPTDIEIVPTVFLTNATVRRIPLSGIPALAGQITQKIQRMATAAKLPPIREIQLDCDWTGETRVTYFTLLQDLANLIQPQQIAISATIRLHQVKYADDMGIPPVARGMLMCYNMASPTHAATPNAIFDLPLIEKYLRRVETYPLPLDVALPLFSWGVVYRRERFVMLINNARTSVLETQSEFTRDRDGMFLAQTATFINGQEVLKGERVRVDEPHIADTQRLARLLAAKLWNSPISVAWFHYDPAVVQHYDMSAIERAYLPFECVASWRNLWNGK